MPKDTTAIETTNADKIFDLPVKLQPGQVNTMSFSQDSISEMHLTPGKELQISFQDGSKVQIDNFQELVGSAQSCGRDTIIQLSDNTIIYPDELNAQLSKSKGTVSFNEKAADGHDLITLSEPLAGQSVEKTIQPGHEYKMGFNMDSTSSAAQAGQNLIMTFKDGGVLVLKNYFTAMNSELPPALTLADGSVVNSDALLTSCKLVETPSYAQTVADAAAAKEAGLRMAKAADAAPDAEPAAGEEGGHHAAAAKHAKKGDNAPDVEPAAGDNTNVADIQPAAGNAGGLSGGRGGYGFASEPSSVSLAGLSAIGAIGATALNYTAPDFRTGPVAANLKTASTTVVNNPFAAASIQILDETSPVHHVGGKITFNFGSDGPSQTVPPVQATGDFGFAGSTNGTLSSHGVPVVVTYSGGTYTGTANGATVFTFVIDKDGNYTFTQNAPLDHANATDPNDMINLDFGVVGTDKDGDQAITSVTINVLDDGPVAVDDNNTVGSPPVIAIGNVLTNDTVGYDSSAKVVSVTFNGTTIAVPTVGTTTVVGTYGTLHIAADGTYTYTSSNTALGTDHFAYTMKDYDGDTSTANLNIEVTDLNTVPTITNDTQTVDETNFDAPGGTLGVIAVKGAVTANYFADGAGPTAISATGHFTAGGSEAAGKLTSGGVAVVVTQVGNVYTGMAGKDTVFTLTINADGTYNFVLVKPLDHADKTNPDDVINLHFGVVATDADGDKSTAGTITINVKDDGPHAVNDDVHVTSTVHTATGNVVANDTFGADGKPSQAVTKVTFNGIVHTVPADGSDLSLTSSNGTLVINKDGKYTYTATTTTGGVDTFTYVIQDKDGDTDTTATTATLKITIDDVNYTPTVTNDTQTVDETNLSPTTSVTGSVTANYFSDGAGATGISANGTFTAGGSELGNKLTSGGVSVIVTQSGNVYTGKAGADTVFTLTINKDGTYNFVLVKPLDHADKTNPDDVINLHFGVVATDADGDKSTEGTININVKDDGPHAVNDDVHVTAAVHTVNGNVVTNDSAGHDGFGSQIVTKVTFGGVTKVIPADGSNVDFVTANGHLVINKDGVYTYTTTTTTGGIDTFSYVIQDKDGDTDTTATTATLKITIDDVNYTPTVTNDTQTVDETNLSPTTSVTGSVTANYFSDGAGATGISANGTFTAGGSEAAGKLTSGGVAVTVTQSGNVYTGKAGADTVFTLTINKDGSYTFVLDKPLDHADKTNPDDVINLHFGVVATDADGDKSVPGTININVKDDGPHAVNDSIDVNAATHTAVGNVVTNDTSGHDGFSSQIVTKVTFGGVTKAIPADGSNVDFVTVNGHLVINKDGAYTYTASTTTGGTDTFTYVIQDKDGDTDTTATTATLTVNINDIDYTPTVTNDTQTVDETNLSPTTSVTGSVTANYFSDGAGATGISANGTFTAGGSELGNKLTSGGVSVIVTQSGNVYTGKAGADTVFTLTINKDGSYTFVLDKPLDHADKTNPDDVINLHFGVVATDADGDKSVPGTININVKDDGPHAVNDDVHVGSTVHTVTGNVTSNDTFGADGQPSQAVTKVTFGGVTHSVPADGTNLTVTSANGTLVINKDGVYTYTVSTTTGGVDTFTYVIQDKDGDTATTATTATLKITIDDVNYTPTVTSDTQTVDETNMGPTTSVTGSVTANYFSDGAGATGISANGSFTAGGSEAAGKLTSGGVAVTVTQSGNVYTGKAGADTVFTLTINKDGSYTFVLDKPLDHADKTNPDDVINLHFGVVATDADGDKSTAGTITINVKDDGPHAVNDDVHVTSTVHTATGNVVANDTFGADGKPSQAVTKVTFNGIVHTVPADGSDLSLTSSNGTLVINKDGKYTYTATTTTGGVDTFTYVIQDKDGDTDTTATTATLKITIDDVNYTPTVTNDTQTVDETNLSPTTSVTGSVTANYFSDGAGATGISANGTFTAGGSEAAGKLTSGGVAVTVTQSGNVYTGKAGADTVFTLTINKDGSYTFVLDKPLDHADKTNPDDVINLHFGVVATDADGDKSVPGTININVKDDGPHAVNDTATIAVGTTVATGNVVTNDSFGADGKPSQAVTKITFNGATFTVPADGTSIKVVGSYGSLEINKDGVYKYTSAGVNGGGVDHFTYTIADKDGDTDTSASQATLTVTVNESDDTPTITSDSKVVDETNMSPTTSVTGSVTANYFSDGPGKITGANGFSFDGSAAGGHLTSGGVAVTVSQTGNVYTGKAGSETVFTLTINENGSYTFVLDKPLDHADKTNPNDIINLHFTTVATDVDGDTAHGTINIAVLDDGPTIGPSLVTVQEADITPVATATGAVTFNYGHDGGGTVTSNGSFTADGSVLGGTLTSKGVAVVVTQTADGYVGKAGTDEVFKLTINADGTYKFTESRVLDHANKTDPHDIINLHFGVTATDHDGDTATSLINVNVVDDGPSVVPTPSVAVCANDYIDNLNMTSHSGAVVYFTADGSGQGQQTMHIVISGISPGWTFYASDANGHQVADAGTYNKAAGTWTIDMGAGKDFVQSFFFHPPTGNPTDLNNVTITATVTENGHSSTSSDSFNFIVDGQDATTHALVATPAADALGADAFSFSNSSAKAVSNDNTTTDFSKVIDTSHDTTQAVIDSFVYSTSSASSVSTASVTAATTETSTAHAVTVGTTAGEELLHTQAVA